MQKQNLLKLSIIYILCYRVNSHDDYYYYS